MTSSNLLCGRNTWTSGRDRFPERLHLQTGQRKARGNYWLPQLCIQTQRELYNKITAESDKLLERSENGDLVLTASRHLSTRRDWRKHGTTQFSRATGLTRYTLPTPTTALWCGPYRTAMDKLLNAPTSPWIADGPPVVDLLRAPHGPLESG